MAVPPPDTAAGYLDEVVTELADAHDGADLIPALRRWVVDTDYSVDLERWERPGVCVVPGRIIL